MGTEGPAAHDELRRGGGQEGGNDESGLAGCFGDEGDAGEWSAVAGAEKRGDADGGKESRVGCVGDGLDDLPRDRALGHEGNEEPADTAAGHGEPCRREPHQEECHEQAERGFVALRPGDGLVAGSEADGSIKPLVGSEREDEQREARSRDANGDGDREVLGVRDRPCPDSCQRAAQQADDEAAEEVAQVERGTAGDLDDAPRTEERDERDIGGARGDERREQRPAREILGVGDLEREDDAGERRAEHRRDPGGGAGHHEHLGVVLAEALHEAALGPRADGRAAEQRRALVTERAARAQRRGTLEELRPEIPHAHGAAAFVIRADVRVGRRGVGMSRQSRHQHRDGQSDSWDRGRQRHRLSQHPREHAVADDLVERGDDARRSTRRPLPRGRAQSADDDQLRVDRVARSRTAAPACVRAATIAAAHSRLVRARISLTCQAR